MELRVRVVGRESGLGAAGVLDGLCTTGIEGDAESLGSESGVDCGFRGGEGCGAGLYVLCDGSWLDAWDGGVG